MYDFRFMIYDFLLTQKLGNFTPNSEQPTSKRFDQSTIILNLVEQ